MKRKKIKRQKNNSILYICVFIVIVGLLITGIIWSRGGSATLTLRKQEKPATITPGPLEKGCEGEKYSNLEQGYEICYPKGWFYKEFGETKETTGFDRRPFSSATEYLGRILLETSNIPSSDVKTEIKNGLSGVREEEFSVGGIKGLRIEGTINANRGFFNGQEEVNVILENREKTWRIVLRDAPDSYIALMPIFIDMADSLRFITPNPSTVSSSSGKIVVYSPLPDSTVMSPLRVSGKANVPDNLVNIRLEDDYGETIARTSVYTKASEAGSFGDFEAELYYSLTAVPYPAKLKIFTSKITGEGDEDLVEIPLKLR